MNTPEYQKQYRLKNLEAMRAYERARWAKRKGSPVKARAKKIKHLTESNNLTESKPVLTEYRPSSINITDPKAKLRLRKMGIKL